VRGCRPRAHASPPCRIGLRCGRNSEFPALIAIRKRQVDERTLIDCLLLVADATDGTKLPGD
jgi:hypothetical protein